jgi:hypothetical protein
MNRAAKIARLELIHSKTIDEDRDTTLAEQTEFDQLVKELQMDATVRKQPDVASLRPVDTPSTGKSKIITRGSLLLSAIALASGDREVDVGAARELDSETRKRNPWKSYSGIAMPLSLILGIAKAPGDPISALAGGAAASTVGVQNLDELFFSVDTAIHLPLVASRLGVNTIVATEETLKVPVLTSTITPTWVGRDQDLSASGATFDSVTALPKTCGALVTIRRSALLYSSHPAVQAVIQAEMEAAMRIALDQAVMTGAGTNAPVGLFTQATSDGALTDLSSAYGITDTLLDYTKSDAGLRWALPNLTVALLSMQPMWTTLEGGSAPLPALQNGMLAGYPVTMNLNAPAGSSGKKQYLFGDFSYVHLILWDSASIAVDPYSAFASGAITLRIMCDANVLVRDPKRILKGDADLQGA